MVSSSGWFSVGGAAPAAKMKRLAGRIAKGGVGVKSRGSLSPTFPYWSLRDRRSWTIVLRGEAGGVRHFAGRITVPRRRRNARPRLPASPRIIWQHTHIWARRWRKEKACGRRASQRDDPARLTKPPSATFAQEIAHHRRGASAVNLPNAPLRGMPRGEVRTTKYEPQRGSG